VLRERGFSYARAISNAHRFSKQSSKKGRTITFLERSPVGDVAGPPHLLPIHDAHFLLAM
jgi:hypothetical protein